MEDLNQFQQVQILTSAINHMAYNLKCSIDYINPSLEAIPQIGNLFEEEKAERIAHMEDVLNTLSGLAEKLGNVLDGIDYTADVDAEITKTAFEIVNNRLEKMYNDGAGN